MRGPEATDSRAEQFPRFVRARPAAGLAASAPPRTVSGWESRLSTVRDGLRHSFGRVPESACPLEPELLGTLRRDGYVIERLTLQSRPGVRVTANLYRPADESRRYPGVLCVHGHWPWARIDPVVQTRCIGLAKLGYVCLCVDAFGAGERAERPGPGTYHGGLLGASLWPAGVPLLGLQVYDNRRAVDYLVSRPEVDPGKLAITGASGGGNQSLYAGATDERLTAVVPVCGIGTYDSYLATACCVCEVNARGLTYATTGDLLAMIAPRALLVVSATRDAPQFSASEAARSVAHARERFRLLGREDALRQVAIESGHDYNRPMREAMYGWLERWLKGRGDGGPVTEPEIRTEDPNDLRCYPDGKSRPVSIVAIPEYAHREGLARLGALPPAADHRERWEADSARMRSVLRDRILGGFPRPVDPETRIAGQPGAGAISVEMTPEPGLRLSASIRPAGKSRDPKPPGTVMMLGSTGPGADPAAVWADAGYAVASLGIRATGPWKPKTPVIAGIADHNEAEWALWTGRPLLGQWVWDVLRWVQVLCPIGRDRRGVFPGVELPGPLIAWGRGPMALAAVLAAAFEPRIDAVVVDGLLVSFVGRAATPWSGVPMGIIVPDILEVGDTGHLAALVAPRPLRIAGGFETDGSPAGAPRLNSAFAYTRSIYALLGASSALKLGTPAVPPPAV
jgi:dienelactone hydrolase